MCKPLVFCTDLLWLFRFYSWQKSLKLLMLNLECVWKDEKLIFSFDGHITLSPGWCFHRSRRAVRLDRAVWRFCFVFVDEFRLFFNTSELKSRALRLPLAALEDGNLEEKMDIFWLVYFPLCAGDRRSTVFSRAVKQAWWKRPQNTIRRDTRLQLPVTGASAPPPPPPPPVLFSVFPLQHTWSKWIAPYQGAAGLDKEPFIWIQARPNEEAAVTRGTPAPEKRSPGFRRRRENISFSKRRELLLLLLRNSGDSAGTFHKVAVIHSAPCRISVFSRRSLFPALYLARRLAGF